MFLELDFQYLLKIIGTIPEVVKRAAGRKSLPELEGPSLSVKEILAAARMS
jgi:hypothetical protein